MILKQIYYENNFLIKQLIHAVSFNNQTGLIHNAPLFTAVRVIINGRNDLSETKEKLLLLCICNNTSKA